MSIFQTLENSGKSIKQIVRKSKMSNSQHGFIKSKSCKADLSYYSRANGLGDVDKGRVFHLDFCCDVV